MFKTLKIFCIFGLSLFLVGCFDTSSSSHVSPYLGVSPSEVSVSPGQAETITLTNSGAAVATGITVSLSSGIDATTFSNNCGTSLAAGASCEIDLTTNINDITAQTGAITIAATSLSPVTVPVHVVLPSLAFSNTNISRPGSFDLTVSNTSNNPAYINGVDFVPNTIQGVSLTSNGCLTTLAAGATCTIAFTVSADAYGQAELSVDGNFTTTTTAIQVSPVEITVTDDNNATLGSVVLTNDGNPVVIRLHNTGYFNVQNPNLSLPTITDVTFSGTCNSLPAEGSCEITATPGDQPDGAGTLSFDGANVLAPVSLSIAAGYVTMSPVTRAAEAASQRGLKYAEIEVENHSGGIVSLQSITSNLSNVTVASDSNHLPSAGCAIDGSLADEGSCTFWVTTADGPDVGEQTGILTVQYSAPSGTETAALNLNVETDLYYAGEFQTITAANCGGANQACISLAKWNGNAWSAVGGEANFGSRVQGLTVGVNGELYVEIYDNGLVLTSADPDLTTHHFAVWDGAVWSGMAGGIDQASLIYTYYNQMWVWDGDILYFVYSDGANYKLASWSPSTNTLNQSVYTFDNGLTVSQLIYNSIDNKLYASFDDGNDPGLLVQSASVSDPTSWSPIADSSLGFGLSTSLGFAGSNYLVAGGYFSGDSDKLILVHNLTDSSNNTFIDVAAYSDAFLQSNHPSVGSADFFYTVNSNTPPGWVDLYKVTNNDFSSPSLVASTENGAISSGLNTTSSALAILGNNYYFAGNFAVVNGVETNCIAKSTDAGVNWAQVGGNELDSDCGGVVPASANLNRFVVISPTLTVSN